MGLVDMASTGLSAFTTRASAYGLPMMHLLLLLALATSFVASFVPSEKFQQVRRIRSPAYDVPPKGIWGDYSPLAYNSATTTNYFSTVPPPRGNQLIVPSRQVVPAPLPPLDLAKHFVELSKRQLKSIQVEGPSFEDLYEKTKTIRAIMREKERLFQEILGKQKDEYDEVKRQFKAWQAYYNRTLDSLQSKTEQQEMDVASKTFLHENQMKELQTRAEHQEKTASERMLWLTNQLQQLKVEAHKKQVEMAQLAEEKQAQLQQRVSELQSKLDQQIRLAQTETFKYQEQLTKRNELELELTQVRTEFQKIMRQLEGQLSAEQAARAEERRQAAEQLESERVKAEQALQTAKQEIQSQMTALQQGLQAKDVEHERTIQQIQSQAQTKESQLTWTLESARTQLQSMQTSYQKQLESEKEAALKIQTALLAQIKEKEVELARLQTVVAGESSRAKEIQQNQLELKHQLATLKSNYESALSLWAARYQSLQQELMKEKSEAQAILAKEREQAQMQINEANKKVDESKMAFDSGLAAKQAQFHQAIQDLREVSAKTENDLRASLRQLSEALQEHKLNTHKELKQKMMTFATKENELRSVITKRDKELEEQVSRTKQEAERAAGYWQSRIELEKELSFIKAHYQNVTESWEKRLRTLEETRSREQQAASNILARKESEARLQIKQAHKEFEELEASVRAQLEAKDVLYEERIRELNMVAKRKEKELTDNLERLSNEFQQLKLESHKKLMEEKDASMRVQQDLLARIAGLEKELEEANTIVEIQSERANEFSRKRVELEKELSLINKTYDTTFETWEQMAQAFENAREKERAAVVSLLAHKEAERHNEVTTAVDENGALKGRDSQFEFLKQELRDESKQKERELCTSMESISQQLQDLTIGAQQTQFANKQVSSKMQEELAALIESKDRELELQRQLITRQREEAEKVGREQLEIHRAIRDLKQQHAETIANSNARYNLLVRAREQERQAAARKLAQLESEARARIDAAVAMAQKYESIMKASVEKVSRMESYLQSEIGQLHGVVTDTSQLCSNSDEKSDAI